MTEINNWLFTTHFVLFPIEKLLREEIPHPYFAEDVMLLSGTAWKKEDRPLKSRIVIDAQNTKDQLYYSGTTDEKEEILNSVEEEIQN